MLFLPSDQPLRATILVLPDASLMSLAATLDPLRAANRTAGAQPYRWSVVSADGRPVTTSCGLPVQVDGAFQPQHDCDLLIVVAAFNVMRHATPAILSAVRQGARRARLTGGVEAGSWVLAMAGLLDRRKATTHWEDLEDFAARFPQVRVIPDRWVVDGPVFTTGGAAPALDFMLALIRARQGFGAALNVASLYVYEEVRLPSDAQPLVSLGRAGRLEQRLATAIRIMEEHLDSPLPIAAIAERVGCSTRTLEGLFREIVETSPAAYYQSLRLQAARRLITDTDLGMADVAVRTGFASIASLSRAFRRRFGHPPSAARRSSRG
ncbi:GlxA family transcriptional regulator [Paracoccus shanxieyensis]|uniref:Helix-turn-helix domain-containing protein n=1 Tax=Paracoccus shanxieyensis TaxID=2675752 RepID=A0A6L6J325_9RHOB|nr:GlxA family transcriptional regulator [Paracoccus shanxieyensis]MTH65650.1 helix-turn-helix domain-containing protein [Paracoccus shanxieyensis]MTH88775.1 helix-turn-helix domain-containing protein [Paracoccus shanxieyensis]